MRPIPLVFLAAGLLLSTQRPTAAFQDPNDRVLGGLQEASPAADRREQQKVTLNLKDVPLRSAIEQVLAGSGLQYAVHPDVPDAPVNLNVKDLPAPNALSLLIRLMSLKVPGLTLGREGDVRVIRIGTDAPAGEERKVTLTLKDFPLRKALGLIFQGSGRQYLVEPNVPDVPLSLSLKDLPFTNALSLALRVASAQIPGLTRSMDGNIHIIRIRPGSPPLPERKITLHLKEVPLYEAMQRLFEGSGLQYAIEPNVPNVPITANLRDVTLPQGLQVIFRLAHARVDGLNLKRSGTLYTLRQGSTFHTPAPAPAEPPDADEGSVDLVWEKIPLRHLDALVVATWLGGTVLPSAEERKLRPAAPRPLGLRSAPTGVDFVPEHVFRAPRPAPAAPQPCGPNAPPPGGFPGGGLSGTSPGGGSTFYPGGGLGGGSEIPLPESVEAIIGLRAGNALLVRATPEDVQELRALLRQMDVPARQVQVRLSTGPLSAAGQVLSLSPLRLSDSAGKDRLDVTLTPRVTGDGAVDVAVDGVLNVGGVRRELKTRVRLTTGQAAPIFTLGEGSRQVRVWLRAAPVQD